MNFVAITALLTFCVPFDAGFSLPDEPQCSSRFDYEFKVVQKLFMLENAHNEQLEINKALRTEINSMKLTRQEQSEEIKNMKAVLQDTNNRNKDLVSTVESMKNVSAGNRGNCLILFLFILFYFYFYLFIFCCCCLFVFSSISQVYIVYIVLRLFFRIFTRIHSLYLVYLLHSIIHVRC